MAYLETKQLLSRDYLISQKTLGVFVITKWMLLIFGLVIYTGYMITLYLFEERISLNGIDHIDNQDVRTAYSIFTLFVSILKFFVLILFGVMTYLMWKLLSDRKYLRKNENTMIAKVIFSLASVVANLTYCIILKYTMNM
jgi:hypothetical protein